MAGDLRHEFMDSLNKLLSRVIFTVILLCLVVIIGTDVKYLVEEASIEGGV